jgi:hypothetical protein
MRDRPVTDRPARPPLDGSRRELEHEADLARARLLGTIGELDRRRHELLDLRLQIRRHASDVLAAVGGLLIGIGATAALLVYRERRHERHIREERLRAVVRLWRHPERIAARRNATATVLRLALVALATMATTTFGTRQLDRIRRRPRLPAHPIEPLGL